MAAIEAGQLRNIGLLGHRGPERRRWERRCCSRRAAPTGLAGSRTVPRRSTTSPRKSTGRCHLHGLSLTRMEEEHVRPVDTPVSPPSCRRPSIRWPDSAGRSSCFMPGRLRVETERLWGYVAERGMPDFLRQPAGSGRDRSGEAVDAIAAGSRCEGDPRAAPHRPRRELSRRHRPGPHEGRVRGRRRQGDRGGHTRRASGPGRGDESRSHGRTWRKPRMPC